MSRIAARVFRIHTIGELLLFTAVVVDGRRGVWFGWDLVYEVLCVLCRAMPCLARVTGTRLVSRFVLSF